MLIKRWNKNSIISPSCNLHFFLYIPSWYFSVFITYESTNLILHSTYCMPKKSWPILCSNLLYNMCQDFMKKYYFGSSCLFSNLILPSYVQSYFFKNPCLILFCPPCLCVLILCCLLLSLGATNVLNLKLKISLISKLQVCRDCASILTQKNRKMPSR